MFEVDRVETQRLKRERLSRALGTLPQRVTFADESRFEVRRLVVG